MTSLLLPGTALEKELPEVERHMWERAEDGASIAASYQLDRRYNVTSQS